MRLVQEGSLGFGTAVGRWWFPEYSLTLIAKAEYQLVERGPAARAGDEPCPLDGDVLDGELCAYEADFAYFKPRADALLRATCHPPGGQPADMCQVTFGLGTMQKSLVVFGDREVQSKLLSRKVGEPQPFTTMPLDWTRAHAGPANPVGRGKSDPVLANVEYLPSSKRGQDPAGFGPILRTWKPRQDKLGTYRRDYEQTRWPWFAEDLDPSYFNAAPEDQQLDGYLRGDEEIYLQNVLPDVPEFRGRLPGVRVRAFVDAGDSFEEVEMHLDTAFVDADAGTLILLWRGLLRIADQDHSEIAHVYLAEEPLAETPRTPQEHAERFAALLSDDDEEEPLEPEPPQEEPDDAADSRAQPDLGKLREAVHKALGAAGLDPSLFDSIAAADDPKPILRAAMAELDIAPVDVNALLAASRQKTVEALIAQGHDPAPFLEALETRSPAETAGEAGLTRETLEARHAAGESLANEDLTGLDLAGIDLRGADLSGAVLTGVQLGGAVLAGCKLASATLQGAALRGADLSESDLSEADLHGADLGDADLTRAHLGHADLSGANLCNAKLTETVAPNAEFSGAALTDADLAGADLSATDFGGTKLDRCRFSGANLSQAAFEGATGAEVDFTGADLTGFRANDETALSGARFDNVTGPGAIFGSAVLDEARFTGSSLVAASFVGGRAAGADFTGSDLTQANFTKAELTGSSLARSNGMQANFERAVLRNADLSGSNLYQAEFLDTVLEGAKVDDAFLAGSKLAALGESR